MKTTVGTYQLDVTTTGTVLNSTGHADGDLQVQGDTEANMIFVDASTDTVYIGGTTNGVSIAKGAGPVMNGTSTTWIDQLPTSYIQLSGGGAPNITLVGASSRLRAQEFPNVSPNEEYLPIWQLNHNWKEGSAVVPHLHLYIPDDGTGGDVVFGMYYIWSNIGDTSVSEVGPVYGTVTRAANAGIAANAILSFGSIAGTNKTFSSILRAHIFRVQAGADTFSGTCWLLSGDLHIECDKLGTNNELS